MKNTLLTSLILLAFLLNTPDTYGDDDSGRDSAQLGELLRGFLAGTERREVHDRFWADDLIYTSSAGARYGKEAILAGFDDGSNSSRMQQDYGAEEVTIRVHGDIAVVTFRLTADTGGERVGEYFNTGVFRRDGDGWRAFTWQATRIPQPSAPDPS